MKKITILTMAVLAVLTISCKNTKTTEPTPEEIQAQKVALADSVLAQIDEYAEQFSKTRDGYLLNLFALTDEEKIIKPDYLLEPSEVSKFITKTQKVNALAH